MSTLPRLGKKNSETQLIMDPELQINLHDSEDNLYDDLFETGFPPATTQQSDHSKVSQQSCLHSVVNIPQPRRHLHSSSPNEISLTPGRFQASSPPSARAESCGRPRHSRESRNSPHRKQPPSRMVPGHPPPHSAPPLQSGHLHVHKRSLTLETGLSPVSNDS